MGDLRIMAIEKSEEKGIRRQGEGKERWLGII